MKVVIFNVFGHLNRGDGMLLETLVALVRHHGPQVTINGVAFDPNTEEKADPTIEWSARIGSNGPGGEASRLLQAWTLWVGVLIATIPRGAFMRWLLPRSQRRSIESLMASDLAISCPGGYLEDSNVSYLVNSLQILLAKRLSGRVILAPQSVGPVRSKLGRAVISHALRGCEHIYVREHHSKAFVREVVGDATPQSSVGDLAFWYSGDVSSAEVDTAFRELGISEGERIVGLTVVDWNFPGHPDPQTAKSKYLRSLTALCRRVIQSGARPLIFNQVSSDLSLANRLEELVPDVIVDRLDRNCGLMLAMIRRCELFIGTRFHSCIFALISGRPTGAISYLPKTAGIMEDLALAEYCLQIDNLEEPELVALYDRLRQNAIEVGGRVDASVSEYRLRRGAFVNDVARWLG